MNIRIFDLDRTIRVGLIKSKFEVINETASISVSSETVDFLFNQLFARVTISINGRISFNYETAYKFLFFFIPYANNIGTFFNRRHILSKEMLRSIMHTSIMMAKSYIQKYQ